MDGGNSLASAVILCRWVVLVVVGVVCRLCPALTMAQCSSTVSVDAHSFNGGARCVHPYQTKPNECTPSALHQENSRMRRSGT